MLEPLEDREGGSGGGWFIEKENEGRLGGSIYHLCTDFGWVSGRTEYSHQASSPNDQHLAAHFPSRPEFALFTSLSYRSFTTGPQTIFYCGFPYVHPVIVPPPTFTTWIFYRNYHDDLGQRTARVFHIRVSGYVEKSRAEPICLAWHHDRSTQRPLIIGGGCILNFFLLVPFGPRGYLISIFAVSVASERSTVNDGQ